MSVIVELKSDGFAVGTDVENNGNGWTVVDQGSSATATVQTYPTGKAGYSAGRNSVRNVTTGGLWCYFGTSDVSYTNVDWRGNYTCNTTTVTLVVRSGNNSFFPNGYGIRLSGGSTVEFVKICGVNIYVMASTTLTHNLGNGIVFRINITGYLVSGWINDTYVGSHDFTGNVLCGSVSFPSGGVGAITFSATQYLAPTRQKDTSGGFI